MIKKLCYLLVLISTHLCAWAQTVHPGYEDGKIWVKVKNDAPDLSRLPAGRSQLRVEQLTFLNSISKTHRLSALERPFVRAMRPTPLKEVFTLSFEDVKNVDQIIAELEASGIVEYAEKVPLNEKGFIPDDYTNVSSYLDRINAPTAWNYAKGDGSIVAIVDDAVDITHPDLAPNLWVNADEIPDNGIDDDANGYIDDIHGADVINTTGNPMPPANAFSHGTGTASVAAAATNNGIGLASIGYNCKIMAIRAANSAGGVGAGYPGILYAADNGAHVVSCSWSSTATSNTAQQVIAYARSRGVIVVGSAGNYSNSIPRYPAAYPGVVAVAATFNNDRKTGFSNYGTWITICAPGDHIGTAYPGGIYTQSTGTSYSAPMVAGLLALMRSHNPALPADTLIKFMNASADNINAVNPGYIGRLGAGRINAGAALQQVHASLSNIPSPVFTANYTTITEGGVIAFAGQSIYTDPGIYGPVTYQWSFPGGTPATYTGPVPPSIVYSTAGVYDVSLTVINKNGLATAVKNNYITVQPLTACRAVNYPLPAGWDSINYYLGSPEGLDGWINGVNVTLNQQKAQYFDVNAAPATHIPKVRIGFGFAYSDNPAKQVPVHILDGTTGTPGAVLGTGYTTMGQIMQDVQNQQGSIIQFDDPVAVPVSNRFFVSVDLRNLCWDASCKDTLSIYSAQPELAIPSPVWEMKNDGSWLQYGSASSYYLRTYLYIHPYLTNEPARSVFTMSADTVCKTGVVSFNATGSTYQDELVWTFAGGTPGTVNGQLTPSVQFNNAGPHEIKLMVKGGSCQDTRVLSKIIQVNDPVTPAVQVAGTPYQTPGAAITFTATATHTGETPEYEFLVNGESRQNGNDPVFVTTNIALGDTVSCLLYSSLDCITVLSAASNNYVVTTAALPLLLDHFKGKATAAGNILTWRTLSESNTASFVIERSDDGIRFKQVGTVKAAGNSQHSIDYTFTDRQTFAGLVFYRLRMTDLDGTGTLSSVITLEEKEPAVTTLKLWPQPAQAGTTLNVKLNGPIQGRIAARITNSMGQVVRTIFMQGSSTNYLVAISTHGLAGGLYFIHCYNSDQKIVGKSKFVIE